MKKTWYMIWIGDQNRWCSIKWQNHSDALKFAEKSNLNCRVVTNHY